MPQDNDHNPDQTGKLQLPSGRTVPASPPRDAGFSSAAGAPRLTSEQLFRGHDEVLIGHAGDTYRLRITRQGKLILTK